MSLLLVAGVPGTHAQSTWTGNIDNLWSEAGNWSGTPPVSFGTSDLVFNGTSNTSTSNDLTGFTASSLSFTNTAAGENFTLSGNSITLGGNITTSAASGAINNLISLNLMLDGNRTITTATSHSIEISGLISETGGARNLIKGGVASLTLANAANSFTGQMIVNAGSIIVSKLADAGVNSSIGAGTGANAVIRLGNASATGTLNYNGSGDTTDRQVQIGNGNAASSTGGANISNNGTGALVFTNSIFNSPNATAIVGRNVTLGGTNTDANEVQGIIQDNSASAPVTVVKANAGTWTLSAANTHTGGTTLNAGLLNIGHASALSTGPFNIGGNGSFDNTTGAALTLPNPVNFSGGSPTFVGTDDMTFTGLLTISGANRTLTVSAGHITFSGGTAEDATPRTLTKNGDGTLTLGGPGGHTNTTLSAGTLNIGHASALGSGTFTASGGASFDNTSGGSLTAANAVNLNGNTTFIGSNDLAFNGAVTMNGNRTVTVSGGTLTFNGPVGQTTGGDRTLTKAGSGTLELLSAGSDFTGQMLLNAGTLVVAKLADAGVSSSIGAGTGTNAVIRLGNGGSTGTLEYIGSGDSTNRPVQIGNGTLAGHNGNGVILNNGVGALVFTNAAFNAPQTDAANTGNRFLVLGGANTGGNEIQGVIADNATPVHLRKQDAGTWMLSGSNTFTGGSEVSGGLLILNHNNALAASTGLTINGGTLDINGTNSSIASGNLSIGSINPSALIDSASGGLFTLQGDIVYGGGSGTWAQAVISANIDFGTDARLVTVSSGSAAVDLDISGVISGGAGATLTKQNPGTLRLTGANTFSDRVSINNGVAQINTLANAGSASSLGTGDSNSEIQLGINANTGTLEFIGSAGGSTDRQIQIGGGNNAAHTGGATILNNGAGALAFTSSFFNVQANTGALSRTLTLGGSNTGLNEITGVIRNYSSQAGRDLSLVKQDAGTWILSGNNTYTGTTTINGGTLLINGDQSAATGVLTVAAGATLGGNGTIGGAATIFGTHSPGNSPDLQTFLSDLTYEANATFVWELFSNTANLLDRGNGSTGWDAVNVGGDLTFLDPVTMSLVFNSTGSTVNWTDALWLSDQQWLVWSHTGAGGTFGLSNLSIFTQDWADGFGNSFDTTLAGSSFDLFQSGQDVFLRYTAIPEPGRALLVLAGLAACLLRRRRVPPVVS